jgi:hypothetical protein
MVGADADSICGAPVVVPLMGGTPAEFPERYRQASPQALLPLGVPQVLISAVFLTADKAKEYQKLARAKGDHVEIRLFTTGHFEPIAPGENAWTAVRALILNQAFRPPAAAPGSVK